jgi:hypothetical protein
VITVIDHRYFSHDYVFITGLKCRTLSFKIENLKVTQSMSSLGGFTVQAITQENKSVRLRFISAFMFITFVCLTARAGLPDRAYYWEKTLQQNGFSTDTPEQIIRAARSGSYFVRFGALELLTHRTHQGAITTLKEALDDSHIRVRWTAAHLLFTLGDSSGLQRMQIDFAELVPRNGAFEPADPNIPRDPEAMKEWQRNRLYRIRRALEVAVVLAELADRRGYELAAKEGLENPLAANRSRAVKVLAEIAKTDEAILHREGRDPVSVLSAMAETETRRTVFSQILTSATRLGGSVGLRILAKAKDNPYQSEEESRRAERSFERLKLKVSHRQKEDR